MIRLVCRCVDEVRRNDGLFTATNLPSAAPKGIDGCDFRQFKSEMLIFKCSRMPARVTAYDCKHRFFLCIIHQDV